MAHHVIIVPGLGDNRKNNLSPLLIHWRLFGLKTHYLPLVWGDGEDFDGKFKKLEKKIDSLSGFGARISLVGISAGASAVLNAFAVLNDLNGVVCICGKINNPQTIHPSTFKRNPAFKQSLDTLNTSLPQLDKDARRKIMSIHPKEDSVVPPADTIIPGAVEKQIPSHGHVFSIIFALLLSVRSISKFLRGV